MKFGMGILLNGERFIAGIRLQTLGSCGWALNVVWRAFAA